MIRTTARGSIFEPYPRWKGLTVPGMQTDFLGVHTQEVFYTQRSEPGNRRIQTTYPRFDEEFFKWVSILNAVERAYQSLTVVELGAGYGRWLTRVAAAVKQSRPELECSLVGVEAEPTHYQWLRTHFEDNGLDPNEHWLIDAAVSSEAGWVNFHVGEPAAWYGQCIESHQPAFSEPPRWKRLIHRLVRRFVPMLKKLEPVPAITLTSILEKVGKVDLIGVDIQGSEAVVFESSSEIVNECVSTVHIRTHSEEQEERLRSHFSNLGWQSEFDFTLNESQETPWGRIPFQDGLQTWTNPRF